MEIKIQQILPWRVAQLVGASSRTPKGCEFNSQSGRIPRFQVWSPIAGQMGSNRSMFLSLSLCSFVPSSLSKINKKYLFRWGLRKIQQIPFLLKNLELGAPRTAGLVKCMTDLDLLPWLRVKTNDCYSVSPWVVSSTTRWAGQVIDPQKPESSGPDDPSALREQGKNCFYSWTCGRKTVE